MGSLRWLQTALRKHSKSKGYRYKVVCVGYEAHGKKSYSTRSVHKKKSAALKAARKLNRRVGGCKVTGIGR